MRDAEGLLPDGLGRLKENTGLLLPLSVPDLGSTWRETPDGVGPCPREKPPSRIFCAVVVKREGGWPAPCDVAFARLLSCLPTTRPADFRLPVFLS